MELYDDSEWPKTDFGVVIWEIVFEDPEKGLLPFIGQATTSEQLLERSIIVIKKIYKRKDDPARVKQFTQELIELIPDDLTAKNLDQITEAVLQFLRQIKNFRVMKAALHEKALAEKKKQEEEAGVQAKSEAPVTPADRRTKKRIEPPKKPHILKIIGVGAGVAIAATIVIWVPFLFFDTEKELPTGREARNILSEEIANAVKEKANGKHVFGGPIVIGSNNGKLAVNLIGLPKEHCFGLASQFKTRGRVTINGNELTRISAKRIKRQCAKSGAYFNFRFTPKEKPIKEDKKNRANETS